MSQHEITHYFSNEGTRNEVRKRVVEKLFKEEPGMGTKNAASRYKYHVVKVFKWFFIEQDIRYWNYSGRMKT